MKRVKFLLPVLFAAVIFTNQGCQNYEEGPTISFRSKKARVVNNWEIVKILKNGVEQETSTETDDGHIYETIIWWDFNNDGTSKITERFLKDGTLFAESDEDSTWEFNDDKTEIIIKKDENGDKTTYTILKLFEKEMWLKHVASDGDEYEYHLEPR
jgi:hypothetical protein